MPKKTSVPMPLMRMAMFGSNPMRMGASTVAPNIAMTCCTPIAAVCGHGKRSSGAITPPCANTSAGFAVQSNRAIALSSLCEAMLGAMAGVRKERQGAPPFSASTGEQRNLRQHLRILQDLAVAEAFGRQQLRAFHGMGVGLAVDEAVDRVLAVVHNQRGHMDARTHGLRL